MPKILRKCSMGHDNGDVLADMWLQLLLIQVDAYGQLSPDS